MICPICFGRKYDFKKDGNSGYFVECKKCHGTGIVESQTNEEWFCGLSTEEKAKIFHKLFMARTFCHICPDGNVCDIGYKCKYHEGEVEDFVMWLKQPHHNEGKNE